MKLIIYALLFIITLASAIAGNVGLAEVHLNVVNNPPEIVSIKTSEPFAGEALRCDVTIKDEIEGVKAKYKWYKNDVLIAGQEENVLNKDIFITDDVITCEVTPNDLAQDGDPKAVSVVIKSKPFLSAITGAVVGVGESQGFLSTFLFLLLIASVILGATYFFKKKTN